MNNGNKPTMPRQGVMNDDHIKDQLCQRIEELEKEKLELNERLDIAKQERDALAAHVERVITEWNSGDDLFSDEWISRMGDIVEDAPETSLARLKAQWQAEAIKGMILDMIPMEVDEDVKEFIKSRRDQLRRQAEEG